MPPCVVDLISNDSELGVETQSKPVLHALPKGGEHAGSAAGQWDAQTDTNDLDAETPKTMLSCLLSLFPQEPLHKDIVFEEVAARDVPPRYGKLLNHSEHLTRVLQNIHGGLDITAMESKCQESVYSRRTLLQAPNGTPVGYAILHADLTKLPRGVKEGIEEERIPFGQLLMDHVHTRCVVLKACWRVRACEELLNLLGIDKSKDGTTYARTIIIECDGQDAAQVLEIVQ